ncbi:nitronate monooxygenase [Burkholderia guangdongensis]|uniref:nitronate monooxygenase n=1 Tax=Burkholderia guangdongensis TaxID=1792500 RepID=UPI0015CDC3BC|nr:nitronate monooxygenase [Burkholderia guangdongensis]
MPSSLPDVHALSPTPLCELLGCRYPLVLAGMGGVARSELVAAVTAAGGFGFLGMVREPLELIRDEVARVRRRSDRRFGVNLIPAATDAAFLRQQIDLCIELRVPVVGLFWDVMPDVIARLRAAGIVVVCQVGSVADARQAQAAGADALIAQGVEAGGHVRGRQPLAELLADVLPIATVPVAAAGGIGDGRDVARVLAQGAQAAVLGTVLIATRESFAHDYHKRRLVAAQASDTVLTEAFHINWPPHAAVRVLANSVTRGEHGDPFAGGRTVIGDEAGRPIYLFSTDSPLRSMTGDYEAMALYAGLGVDRVVSVEPAATRVARIVAEAAAQLHGAAVASVDVAAPAGDAAGSEHDRRASILARLDELLEAERAGARVTLESAGHAQDAALRGLIESIHRDEVKWCAMLSRAIRGLDGTPSTRTGAFYTKAMAIDVLNERLAFLNRGQGWVARKVRELLPLVGDAEIRQNLTEMLVAHEENLDKVNVLLDAPR